MTAALLLLVVLLVVAALGAGAAVGLRLGRQQAVQQAAQQVARLSEQELAPLRERLAEAQVAAARAGAETAAAAAERDAAVARAAQVEADRQTMVDQFRLLSGDIAERQRQAVEATAEQRLRATQQLLEPVAAQLETFRTRLGEVERERAAMATDLRAHVREVRDTGEAMRRETAVLVTALRKPQVRGTWGETTLRNVARLAGMVEHCDFDLQATTQVQGQTLRPDMRVSLAEGKHVFVDAKTPLGAFLEAAEAVDETVRAERLGAFARHVRGHVDQLSSKQYWKGAQSPEFVVLFLPSEAFFVAALDQMPDLLEYAATRDVVLATPTTLIGMLRAVSYGWKQAALAEDAAEVARLGRELYDRLSSLGSRFDKLGRALGSAVNAYNETVGTVETRVLVSARRFRDLRVSEQEVPAPEPVETPVRTIAAPELVEDAAGVEPMVGRSPRVRREPPEADVLFRTDPEVDELVDQVADGTGGPAGSAGSAGSAGGPERQARRQA